MKRDQDEVDASLNVAHPLRLCEVRGEYNSVNTYNGIEWMRREGTIHRISGSWCMVKRVDVWLGVRWTYVKAWIDTLHHIDKV